MTVAVQTPCGFGGAEDVELEILVERIAARGDAGFHAFEGRAGGARIRARGRAPGLREGCRVRASGSWRTDRKRGREFDVRRIRFAPPRGRDEIARWLEANLAPLDRKDAFRLADALGSQTLEILAEHPALVARVPGFEAPERARAVVDAFRRAQGREKAGEFLESLGVPEDLAARLIAAYGARVRTVLQTEPWRAACEVEGMSFERADEIGRRFGLAATAEARVRAGLGEALARAAEDGACGVDARRLVGTAARRLGTALGPVEAGLAGLAGVRGAPVEDRGGRRIVFEPGLAAAEDEIARRLLVLAAAPGDGAERRAAAVEAAQQAEGLRLTDAQAEAVGVALSAGAVVVTGGPGTGKSTLTRILVGALERLDRKVALAAPTGRAARRLAEATGRQASTLHRLLEARGGGFVRGAGNPLDAGAVLVDEASMVDVPLMRALLAALPDGARLILVGDVDQLPSVGPGMVLRDVIASGALATARLEEVHRQAADSRIVAAARALNAGRLPDLAPRRDGDFFFIDKRGAAAVAETVVDLAARRLPAAYGLDPMREVQVLAPMRGEPCGVSALNRALQERLNPARGPHAPIGAGRARVGDKVIQTANNYAPEMQVFNGDVGYVRAVDPDGGALSVDFPDHGREVRYEGVALRQLEPAYALTIHRSQGSEFPAVVMPVDARHERMLARELLYTGATRGKRLLVVVGDPEVLARAVRRSGTAGRHTRLAGLLREPAESGRDAHIPGGNGIRGAAA